MCKRVLDKVPPWDNFCISFSKQFSLKNFVKLAVKRKSISFAINLLAVVTLISSTSSFSVLDVIQPLSSMISEDDNSYLFKQIADMLNRDYIDSNSTASSGGKSSLEYDLRNMVNLLMNLIMMEAGINGK
ncbi:hypothetical protein NPIL_308001 [Nephila pilipes]|uniref:Uncharacterized protein n=1 Tax=Nephila pilipes TaxID=299642 RepID=A0A8X6USL9_NEPPI|nr:hypothetical protein NPIL_308001 [Nephila pilipes]